MAPLYFIKDWQGLYENSETRKLKELRWWPKPNKHDGLGFRKMSAEKDAIRLYCAWCLICDLASKTTPKERRGFLERDDLPMSPEDMGFCTGFPSDLFGRALEFFSSGSIGWLCKSSPDTSGDSPDTSGIPPAVWKEGKGIEEKERKGMETASPEHVTWARVAIHHLNEKSGKKFRETQTNLDFVVNRIKEGGVDIDGIKKMIDRQVDLWKGNSDMEQYLRPETLFNKTKFDGYYAAKDLPAKKHHGPTATDHSKGF